MGLAGQIIYLPKEEKQDKTLRELMLMQALTQSLGGLGEMFQRYDQQAKDREFQELKFKVETGLDPKTLEPLPPDQITPGIQQARSEAEARKRLIAGEDIPVGARQALGLVAPSPSPEQQALTREEIRSREGLTQAQIASNEAIAAGMRGTQEAIARLQADIDTKRITSQEKIALSDQDLKRELAYVGFDIDREKILSSEQLADLAALTQMRGQDLQYRLGKMGIKVDLKRISSTEDIAKEDREARERQSLRETRLGKEKLQAEEKLGKARLQLEKKTQPVRRESQGEDC